MGVPPLLKRCSERVVTVRAHHGCVGVHFGAEVTQNNQRFCFAEVLEGDACLGAGFRAEVLVFGEFVKTDEFRAVQGLAIDFADSLNADEAVCATVLDGAFDPGVDGQLFGGEQLLAFDAPVHNPLVEVTLFAGIRHWDGLKVVIVFERGVKVALPVELIDDEVDVLMPFFRHVFN